MSPLRIIILVILFYILFRLLAGAWRKKPVQGKSTRETRQFPANDVLEEDPVCHKLVPRQQAVQHQDQGKTYYFCSQACCNTFRKEQGERK